MENKRCNKDVKTIEHQNKQQQTTKEQKMRDNLREKLNTEITRKQFLQFMGAALLTVFGFHNLLSLLGGSRDIHHVLVPRAVDGQTDGFGTRKFGV